MLEAQALAISGISCEGARLWLAAPEARIVASYDGAVAKNTATIEAPFAVWDVAASPDGLYLLAGGGKLGRRVIFWSFREERGLREFDAPDGAASGLAWLDGKLWLTHRHNRKLFCLDPKNGKVNWTIRTERECFSPNGYKNDLWLIESDPGPLGHWSRAHETRYFFSRYDPAREQILERVAVPFVPTCMAFDGERFWYVEAGKPGVRSAKKDFGQL